MSDEKLLPCPWCGVGMELRPINTPWSDGEPCWSIWHADMEEAIRRKCPMEMGGYGTEAEAVAAWNARAHGALTAEQVREAIKQHSFGIQPELGYGEFGRCFHDKSWQAIADELNGLGEE